MAQRAVARAAPCVATSPIQICDLSPAVITRPSPGIITAPAHPQPRYLRPDLAGATPATLLLLRNYSPNFEHRKICLFDKL